MSTQTEINDRLPMPPVFETIEEERLHRKQRLAAGFRIFSKFGFEEGIAGHITARIPVTPSASGSTPLRCPSPTSRSQTSSVSTPAVRWSKESCP